MLSRQVFWGIGSVMHAELFTLPTFRQSNPDWKRIANVRTTIILEQLDKQSELHLLALSSELNQPQRKALQSLAAIARRVQELPSPSEFSCYWER